MNKQPLEARDPRPIEPRIKYINERKLINRKNGPYFPKTNAEVEEALHRLFSSKEAFVDIKISNLSRMTGGASKEQFAFDLNHQGSVKPKRYVLRMDPLEGIVETCRLREAELLQALQGIIPVPPVLAYDAEGDYLGMPGVITQFIPGVTKPTDHSGQSVSGIGSSYGRYRKIIAPQFLDILVKLHSWTGWRNKALPNFVVPGPGTNEAALFQVNAWSQVWNMDFVEPVPIITLAENWLRENAPKCEEPCIVHCDYRLGNFMFQEPEGNITTILDWELAHFGDFHEDLAWILQKLFGSYSEEGDFLVCGLMKREAFIDSYQTLSGRKIDLKTLRYYEVLNAYKCAVMDLSSAVIAGKNSNNHQDILITWLASAGAVFLDQIEKLLRGALLDAA